MQAGLALPGVAGVVEHGLASGIPYVAVHAPGRPLAIDTAASEVASALAVASAAARVLRALALAGAVLPDAEPERFLHAAPATLVLADLDGVSAGDPPAASREHARLASELARRLLASASRGQRTDVRETLAEALGETDLVALVAALDRAGLVARGEPLSG
jgi:hypothetical protein